MATNMRVLKVEHGKEPEIAVIRNDVASIQKAVGGYFSHMRVSDDLFVLFDEEADFKGSAYSAIVNGVHFRGTIIFAHVDRKSRDYASITGLELKKLTEGGLLQCI